MCVLCALSFSLPVLDLETRSRLCILTLLCLRVRVTALHEIPPIWGSDFRSDQE